MLLNQLISKTGALQSKLDIIVRENQINQIDTPIKITTIEILVKDRKPNLTKW
jgi:hypothetical protein